jgi:GWxTD domain-containing protein
MKNYLLIILLFLAAKNGISQLDAYLDTKYFKTPSSPILETHIEVYASTISYVKNEEGVGKCKVQITQILKSNDSIIDFHKTILENAEKSAEDVYENLMEIQRYVINNQTKYELEVSILDLNNPLATEQIVSKPIQVSWSEYICEVSDIQLVSSYVETKEENILSKSGYDLLPLLADFFPPDYDKIAYYFELYNTVNHFGEDKFIVSHYIENVLTNAVAGNFSKSKRESAAVVIPVLNAFDISKLPSGDYYVVAEVRDKENKIVAQKKLPFSRKNFAADLSSENLKDINFDGTFVEKMDSDSLDEFIYCLYPIVTDMENRIIDNQVKKYNDTLKRQFIYSYWFNVNNQFPEDAWLDYKEQVNLVDHMFGTSVKEGYETDRGRIYLKYGPPNNVDDRPNEPSAYPYQIWHYYKIGKFNNKKFVFYQPDLVTNDYSLLHSELQGEIQNFKWQMELNSRNTTRGNIDDANEGNYYHYGTNSGTLFEQP